MGFFSKILIMEKIDQNLQKSLKRKSCPIVLEGEEELKKQKFDVILDVKVLGDLARKDVVEEKSDYVEHDNQNIREDIVKDKVLEVDGSVFNNDPCGGLENNDLGLKAPPNTQIIGSPEKKNLYETNNKLPEIIENTNEAEESKTNEKSQKMMEGYDGDKGILGTQKILEIPAIGEVLAGEKNDEIIGCKGQKEDLENCKSQTSLVAA